MPPGRIISSRVDLIAAGGAVPDPSDLAVGDVHVIGGGFTPVTYLGDTYGFTDVGNSGVENADIALGWRTADDATPGYSVGASHGGVVFQVVLRNVALFTTNGSGVTGTDIVPPTTWSVFGSNSTGLPDNQDNWSFVAWDIVATEPFLVPVTVTDSTWNVLLEYQSIGLTSTETYGIGYYKVEAYDTLRPALSLDLDWDGDEDVGHPATEVTARAYAFAGGGLSDIAVEPAPGSFTLDPRRVRVNELPYDLRNIRLGGEISG